MLGCAGSFPGPESACSAYVVEADGFRLLVDFGSGALSALQRYGGMHRIDAILLSHLHGDHMLDACAYVVVRRYDPAGRHPRVPLYGPAGTEQRIAAAYGPEEGGVDDVYEFHDLKPGTFPLGPFAATVERMEHPVETYGVRLEHAGRVFAYSADTAVCDAVVRLAADADLFLCEASYLDGRDNPPGLHLTGGEAGRIAADAGAAHLVLTHLVDAWGSESETHAAARTAFAGEITVARPGAQFAV
ncbi:MBL fold metallo-hydrolase [Pilimelia terevasa]|uniref:MBL fold metallo-hydrolase n=1 Tax=Pilimelia terevasa TaxID=53372 RepID=A0A8J3FE83_9ACTN|nr:MBL fold metallo-hydrolase [Pilimelia terevasa]